MAWKLTNGLWYIMWKTWSKAEGCSLSVQRYLLWCWQKTVVMWSSLKWRLQIQRRSKAGRTIFRQFGSNFRQLKASWKSEANASNEEQEEWKVNEVQSVSSRDRVMVQVRGKRQRQWTRAKAQKSAIWWKGTRGGKQRAVNSIPGQPYELGTTSPCISTSRCRQTRNRTWFKLIIANSFLLEIVFAPLITLQI